MATAVATRSNALVNPVKRPQRPSQPAKPALRPIPAYKPSVASRRNKRAYRMALVATSASVFIIVARVLMSVAVEAGAYEIADLQNQVKETARTASSLEEQVNIMASPQNLAIRASEIGMVSSNTVAYLRLSDGQVLGNPQRAEGNIGDTTLIPNSLLGTLDEEVTVPATVQASATPQNNNPQPITGQIPAPKTH